MIDDTFLVGANAAYLDELYGDYLRDPSSVDAEWRDAFQKLRHLPVTRVADAAPTGAAEYDYRMEHWSSADAQKQSAVLRLINAYRMRSHQVAKVDPLGLTEPEHIPDLDLAFNGLGPEDLDTVFHTGSFAAIKEATLREILDLVTAIYCGPVATEYMHITHTPEKRWIQACLETNPVRPLLSNEERRRVLDRITAAEGGALRTGPTRTNVMDLVFVAISPRSS